jgi:DNA repair protein RadC
MEAPNRKIKYLRERLEQYGAQKLTDAELLLLLLQSTPSSESIVRKLTSSAG